MGVVHMPAIPAQADEMGGFLGLTGKLVELVSELQVQDEILSQKKQSGECWRKTLDLDLWPLHAGTYMNIYTCTYHTQRHIDIKLKNRSGGWISS